MKLIINGAFGHMGRALQKVAAKQLPDSDLILVDPCAPEGEAYPRLADYAGPADCIIDFSHHNATPALTDYAVRSRIPLVVATTGQTEQELSLIRQAAETVPLLMASNLSMGIVVLSRLAKQAARAFPDADIELVEVHHNRKLDVPSGTALTLANGIREVCPERTLCIGRHENGKRPKGEIGVHSLRMGNVVGIHEIHIATDTQTLTLRHEAHDRALFAEGALQAARFLQGKPAGLYQAEDIINEL